MSSWLELDKRSLGLFRIILGLLLMADIGLRALHFRAHYTAEGMFPLNEYLAFPRRWSIFYLNDSVFFVALLLLCYLAAALSLTVGYRTRIAGWICWILILSLFRRNPLVNNSGDLYLPLLLLWGNFLPWGETFSVDSGDSRPKENRVSSLPGFCYLIQVCCLYWFSAVLRGSPEWLMDGSALYYSLHLEPISTSLAPYMLQLGTQPLALITFVTILLESAGPILLLLPSKFARLIGVVLIVLFHIGIFITLSIPVFAAACMVGPIGLLPSIFWDNKLGTRLSNFLKSFIQRLKLRPVAISPRPKLELAYQWLTLPLILLTIFYLHWGISKADTRTPLTSTLQALSLDQRWGMFSPRPPASMGWESAQGRTESGRMVELITGTEFQEGPLKNTTALWQTRWRTFHMILGGPAQNFSENYLRYLVKRWDEEHPNDTVNSAQYLYHPAMTEKHYLLGETGSEVRAVYLK